jgi:hypothetical protein
MRVELPPHDLHLAHKSPVAQEALWRIGLEGQQRRRARLARGRVGPEELPVRGIGRGGEGAAPIYSLIGSAKLDGVDLETYLRETLSRIVDRPHC